MQTDSIWKDKLSKTAAATYGVRLARRAMLRKYCPDGHAVLEIENQLIDMAVAKLSEAISLSEYTHEEIALIVRETAIVQILSSDEDDNVKESALNDIVYMTTEEILPRMN
jgi:hypothetical protein